LTEDSIEKKTENEEKVEVKAESVSPTNGDGNTDSAPPAQESAPPQENRPPPPEKDYYRDRDRRYDGGHRRSDRMSDDEKLKRYKKQSEERLLDIKRSREAKIGKKRR
jgi:hypothetical protein